MANKRVICSRSAECTVAGVVDCLHLGEHYHASACSSPYCDILEKPCKCHNITTKKGQAVLSDVNNQGMQDPVEAAVVQVLETQAEFDQALYNMVQRMKAKRIVSLIKALHAEVVINKKGGNKVKWMADELKELLAVCRVEDYINEVDL